MKNDVSGVELYYRILLASFVIHYKRMLVELLQVASEYSII